MSASSLFTNKLDSLLPAQSRPPSHAEVRALLKRHDLDCLSEGEFQACVAELIGARERGSFTSSITFQVLARSLAKLLALPLAAAAIKRGLAQAGAGEAASQVPDGALVLAVELAARLVQVAFHKLAEAA